MDFIERIQQLAGQVEKLTEHIETEEATKTALIMPFLQALGYNVFDPTEVVPEFVADIGTRRGEKIDYAIMKDGKPVILIEAKSCTVDLDEAHFSQLYRYFLVTDARFAVLTNGIVYRFFTDLDAQNKLDKKHFLEFNMLDVKEPLVDELKKFTKPAFDVEKILLTASDLKYTSEIRRIMARQLQEPDKDFVRYFAAQVHSGPLRASVIEQFTEFTKQAFRQFINDRINDRLKTALAGESPAPAAEKPVHKPVEEEVLEEGIKVATTEDEMQGYMIVKAILCEVVAPDRIVMRDVQSYCGILLDDNNRQPLARLHFNTAQKYIGLFDEEKNEERVPIDHLDDIYKYAAQLKATPAYYDEELAASLPE